MASQKKHSAIEEEANTKLIPDLVRFPQGLSNDILALQRNFSNEHGLMRDIIIFLNKNTQKDIFGHVQFDMKTFADTMGYNPSNLRRTRKDINHNSSDILFDNHTWDGWFENILLLMLKRNIVLENNYEGLYKAESIQMLTSLKIYYDRNNKKAKRIYEVALSPYLFDSYFKEYNLIDFNDYRKVTLEIASKKNKAEMANLYIFLIRAFYITEGKRKKGESDEFICDVDTIAEILRLDNGDNLTRKRKQLVKAALDKLSGLENLKFYYEFVKRTPGSRFKYGIKITFLYKDMDLSASQNFHRWLVCINNAFYRYYCSNIVKKQNANKKEFIQWLQDKKVDVKDKIYVIVKLYKELYKITLKEEDANFYYETGDASVFRKYYKNEMPISK